MSALGLYHDSLFLNLSGDTKSASSSSASTDGASLASPSAWYTRLVFAGSRRYQIVAYVLALTRSVEVVVEMAADRYLSVKARWRVVFLIELVKYVIAINSRICRASSVPLPIGSSAAF